MKKIWITSLAHDQKRVQKTMSMLKNYGLDVNGHFWEDDLQKMAWLAARSQLTDPETALWIILSTDKELSSPTIRYGLSMLTLSVQGMRGNQFPIMLVNEETLPQVIDLPTCLQGATVFTADNPMLGVKIVAQANMPSKPLTTDYRIDVYAMPQLGQWLEIGPMGEMIWPGALFGVYGAEIDAHGVGAAGRLPDRAVLEYPMKGLKLIYIDKEYIAWAVKNKLDHETSYYVRVKGEPDSFLFGPLIEGDNPEVYVLQIK